MTKDRNRNRTLHVLGKRNAIPHGKCAPQQYTVIKEGLRPVRETLGDLGLFLSLCGPELSRCPAAAAIGQVRP